MRPFLFVVVCLAVVLSVPGSLGGSQAAPEIQDGAGDVDPLALTGLKPEALAQVQGNASMYDITKGWVASETERDFWLALQVVDLDAGLSDLDPDDGDAVAPPPLHASFDMRFTTTGGAFIARANLETFHYVDPEGAVPAFAGFVTNMSLLADDGEGTFVAQLFGSVNRDQNTIWMHVPKSAVGDPQPGSMLSAFHAISGHDGQALDFAPDATLDVENLDLDDPGLSPGYGSDYAFGQFPSGAAVFLGLSVEGSTLGQTTTGEPAEFAFRVENGANQEDTVRMSARPPTGWSIAFQSAEVVVPAGSSMIGTFTATPSDAARDTGILVVKATSGLNGQSQEVAYTVQRTDAPAGGGSGGGSDGGGGDGTDGAPDQQLGDGESEDSPGPGVVALAVVGLAGLVAARRHRQVRGSRRMRNAPTS